MSPRSYLDILNGTLQNQFWPAAHLHWKIELKTLCYTQFLGSFIFLYNFIAFAYGRGVIVWLVGWYRSVFFPKVKEEPTPTVLNGLQRNMVHIFSIRSRCSWCIFLWCISHLVGFYLKSLWSILFRQFLMG